MTRDRDRVRDGLDIGLMLLAVLIVTFADDPVPPLLALIVLAVTNR